MNIISFEFINGETLHKEISTLMQQIWEEEKLLSRRIEEILYTINLKKKKDKKTIDVYYYSQYDM